MQSVEVIFKECVERRFLLHHENPIYVVHWRRTGGDAVMMTISNTKASKETFGTGRLFEVSRCGVIGLFNVRP